MGESHAECNATFSKVDKIFYVLKVVLDRLLGNHEMNGLGVMMKSFRGPESVNISE